MQFFRVMVLTYCRRPVDRFPGESVGVLCSQLSGTVPAKRSVKDFGTAERLLEQLTHDPTNYSSWDVAYDRYRELQWLFKRSNIRVPKDMWMEIVIHGYVTRHGCPSSPFTPQSMADERIVKSRDWIVMKGNRFE